MLLSAGRAVAGDLPAAGRGESSPFAGLDRGARVGEWRVAHVGALRRGGRVLVLHREGGQPFELEVLAADDGGPRAPGRSEHFAVFVRNAGDGSTSTVEDHGLAAMALASHLRKHEGEMDRSGFQSMRARSATFAAELE